jgi:hypothetical protein
MLHEGSTNFRPAAAMSRLPDVERPHARASYVISAIEETSDE